MKRGRPMTPTPSASTERSRKSREKAAEKARNEKIIEARKARKEKIIDAYNEPHIQPEHFAMVPQPSEPITVEFPSPRSADNAGNAAAERRLVARATAQATPEGLAVLQIQQIHLQPNLLILVQKWHY